MSRCLAASLATVVGGAEGVCAAGAELASRSRRRAADHARRAAQDAARAADQTARERHLAGEERNRAAVNEVGRRPWLANGRLAKRNARDDAWSALIKRHCFADASSSTPPPPIARDCSTSSPCWLTPRWTVQTPDQAHQSTSLAAGTCPQGLAIGRRVDVDLHRQRRPAQSPLRRQGCRRCSKPRSSASSAGLGLRARRAPVWSIARRSNGQPRRRSPRCIA